MSEREPACTIRDHRNARDTTRWQSWFQWAMLSDHRQALEKLEEAHNEFSEPGGCLLAQEA